MTQPDSSASGSGATPGSPSPDIILALLDTMPDAILFMDPEGTVIRINHTMKNLFPARVGELVGRSLIEVLKESGLTEIRDAIIRARDGNATHLVREFSLGGNAYLGSIARRGEAGNPHQGMTFLLQDISQQKEQEAQLLQTSKMSAVGHLAAGVAHEFNNLIAAIYGYAQYMRENPDPEKVQKGVDIILRSSERARELTGSLLSFSRRKPGRQEPMDVNQVLTDTLLLLNRQFEKSGLTITQRFEELPLTVADAAKLQDVFLNLFLNAEQAMPNGGDLVVESRSEGGMIEILVRDSGHGIRPENVSKIFEPFYTTKGSLGGAKIPGTGLGLSTAYNILRDHGGSIRASSEPGEGSSFHVSLPIRLLHERVEPGPSPSQGPRAPRTLALQGRVLILDEDRTLSALIREILEDLGHQTRVGSAVEARELAFEWSYDLLVVDYNHPAMEGLDLYRRLRERSPDLPILFITSRTETPNLDADGDPWMFRMNKPFRNRDLITLASRILSQSMNRAS